MVGGPSWCWCWCWCIQLPGGRARARWGRQRIGVAMAGAEQPQLDAGSGLQLTGSAAEEALEGGWLHEWLQRPCPGAVLLLLAPLCVALPLVYSPHAETRYLAVAGPVLALLQHLGTRHKRQVGMKMI